MKKNQKKKIIHICFESQFWIKITSIFSFYISRYVTSSIIFYHKYNIEKHFF